MENFYEQLLQRSNTVKNRIEEDIKNLDQSKLNWKESEKKWSVLEVIDHLNKVYDKYLDNFKKTINSAPQLNGETQKKQWTLLGRLSIYSMKPKGQKRRFKMKTFDFFQPNGESPKNQIIEEFLEKKERFNSLIRDARLKNLSDLKMPTALGEKAKFFVPECFDFIMSHEERHMVQIEDVFRKMN